MAALVHVERASPRVGAWAWQLHDRLVSRSVSERQNGIRFERTSDVPATTGRLHRPDGIIVANSVRRLDLQRLIRLARRQSSSTVWYIREATSLAFAAELGGSVDALVANSRPLAEDATRLAGRPCHYVPSVISRTGLVEPAVRRSILLVNAIDAYGLQETLGLAAQLPDHPVVLQESWPLSDQERRRLRSRIDALPNVELRARGPRGEVFRDARVMLAPHSLEAVGGARPRVALEAQLLGVPMIAYDIPGLAAVAASPELLVPPGAGMSAWVDAVRLVESDYGRWSSEARAFADGEVLTPQQTWERFAGRIAPLLAAATPR
jgi:glycosyltransferase involved in cell wall biosynthesis